MKIAIIILFVTMIASVLLSLLINYSTSLSNKDRQKSHYDISKQILKDWSIENAMIINRTIPNQSNIIRPSKESFFDGLIKETSKTRDDLSVEHNLFTIERAVISNQ